MNFLFWFCFNYLTSQRFCPLAWPNKQPMHICHVLFLWDRCMADWGFVNTLAHIYGLFHKKISRGSREASKQILFLLSPFLPTPPSFPPPPPPVPAQDLRSGVLSGALMWTHKHELTRGYWGQYRRPFLSCFFSKNESLLVTLHMEMRFACIFIA